MSVLINISKTTPSFFDMWCCVLIWPVAAAVTRTGCQWFTALRTNNWSYQPWTLDNIVICNPFSGLQIVTYLSLISANHIYFYRVMVTYNIGVYWQLNSVVHIGWTSPFVRPNPIVQSLWILTTWASFRWYFAIWHVWPWLGVSGCAGTTKNYSARKPLRGWNPSPVPHRGHQPSGPRASR